MSRKLCRLQEALWWTERNCACLQRLRTGAFQKLWNCSLHFLCDIAVLILSLLDIRNLSPNKSLPMVYSKARKRQQHFLNSHSSISVCTYFAIFGQSLAKNALNQSLRTTGQLTHCKHVMSRSNAPQLTHLHGDILKLQEKNPQGWSIANPDKFRLNLTTVVCDRQTEIQTIHALLHVHSSKTVWGSSDSMDPVHLVVSRPLSCEAGQLLSTPFRWTLLNSQTYESIAQTTHHAEV